MRRAPDSPRRALPLCLLLAVVCAACGVKGPPVPPAQPPPPAVADLACRAAAQSAALTWSLPAPLGRKAARRAAFGVYQSRSDLARPACATCPLVFEKAATVPYLDSDGGSFYVEVPLEAGYRYVFKVRLERDRMAGPDSNLVRCEPN